MAAHMDRLGHEPADTVELARAASNGDRSAQRQLISRLLDRVGATVRCLTAGDPNTDDYVQDVLIEILRSIGSYRGESSLESWAKRITVRVTMRKINQKNWRAKVVRLEPEREAVAGAFPLDEEVVRHRIWSRVVRALEALNPSRRTVLVLRLMLGYSTDEISELTQVKFNTVKDRLAKGRAELKQHLLEDPILDDLTGCPGRTR